MLALRAAWGGWIAEAVTADAVDAEEHPCLTFTDREERPDPVAAFVRHGALQQLAS